MTSTTAPGPAPAEVNRPTMAACMDALTGHDELEIERRFGAIIERLEGAKYMRALAFSQELHAGLEGGKAYKKVMDLRQDQIAEYFAVADPEPPDDDEEGDHDADAAAADPAAGQHAAGPDDDPAAP